MEESTMVCEKSTHKVEVIKINELLKHENADTLSKIKIYDYTCIVQTSGWKIGDLAAWVPPDSIVKTTRPEFAFLAKKAKADGTIRIRTMKLRGIVSYGLLVPAPEGMKEGDDAAEILGVEHYDPDVENLVMEKLSKKITMTGGEVAKAPRGTYPKYDVDAFMEYGRKVFVEGELVAVTEKIHGCFKEDTPVLMEDGTSKPISNVYTGESVYSYDKEKKEFVLDVVTDVICKSGDDDISWLELVFDSGQTVKCTENHKFLTHNRGWVEACNLLQEDDLVSLEK